MRIIEQYDLELKELEACLKVEASNNAAPLRILEAGCGREWYLKPENVALELTGIDLDTVALNHRLNDSKDLHKAIVGDLRTAALPFEAFDVVYCSFVLEHILGAEQALDNMLQSLKPNGLLIIRVPDLDGVQTFLARRLPRWVAITYYRHVWKIKNAGKPGFAPYPTFHEAVISRSGFHDYCKSRGLSLINEYGVGSYRSRGSGVISHLVPYLARLVAIGSRGKVHDDYVDLTYVARKRPQAIPDAADTPLGPKSRNGRTAASGEGIAYDAGRSVH